MATMTIETYVQLVPILTWKIGYKEVYNFIKNHFIGKMPKDTKIIRESCTAVKKVAFSTIISMILN